MSNEAEHPAGPEKIHDVIITGGGPAGLSAAIYAARGGLDTLVLDRSPAGGALAFAESIENYPGIPRGIRGPELLGILREQAGRFGAEIVRATVAGVNFEREPREVFSSAGNFAARTVIVASGAMGRTSGIPGEQEFLGRGVSYCAVCDAAFFHGRDIAVAGNIGLILEEIDYLLKVVGKVTLITSAEEIAPDILEELAGNPRITLMLGQRLVEIFGGDVVRGIRVVSPRYGESEIAVEGVFLYLQGREPVVDYLAGALPTGEDGCIAVNREDMSTALPGVFAAGDVTCKRVRQAVVAAAEGCAAALSAERYVTGREHVRAR